MSAQMDTTGGFFTGLLVAVSITGVVAWLAWLVGAVCGGW